ncbi:MAG: ferredoxin [Nanoarchaeota archaeon]|nr:ferredoxin [Nanoarchaeota archaeon]
MVEVDKDKCIGCGTCTSICPDVFEMDNDMKAKVRTQKKCPCIKDAINSCPTEAISQ